MTEMAMQRVIIALVVLGVVNIVATVFSTFVSMKMVLYRLTLLEEKTEKHNKFDTRITKIETTLETEAAHVD